MYDHELKTGSQPYDDGSGFAYDIRITSDGNKATIWLGNGDATLIDLDHWVELRDDIDRAITAFRLVSKLKGGA
jgi:hypothetical protein